MITFRMAGLNIGIDNRYIRGYRFDGFYTNDPPDFTVAVFPPKKESRNFVLVKPLRRRHITCVPGRKAKPSS